MTIGGIHLSFVKRFASGIDVQVTELTLASSGVTVLFGSSGAGKTTVLRCLAGLEHPDAGSIRWQHEVWWDAEKRLCLSARARQVGFVPQDYALFPHLSVASNIAYGLQGLSRIERIQRLDQAIRWLDLTGLEARYPGELSGGEQQRVALARAMVRRPRLLLLDEPLAALDSPTRARLRDDLRRILLQCAIPTVLVTHDRFEALSLGDALVVMDRGRIVQHGPVQAVFNQPASAAVAALLAIETIQCGHVLEVKQDLVSVGLGKARLTAVAPELPPAHEVFVCIRAEDVSVVRDLAFQGSPRNQLPAVVRSTRGEGSMVRVELDCGFPLVALLTRRACEELELRPSDQVLALIKAPHIHLIARPDRNPTDNCYDCPKDA
jgi:molybdate transport system ATP-binding protein